MGEIQEDTIRYSDISKLVNYFFGTLL